MKIIKFEEIESWQLARELTGKVYNLTKKPGFSNDYGLRYYLMKYKKHKVINSEP